MNRKGRKKRVRRDSLSFSEEVIEKVKVRYPNEEKWEHPVLTSHVKELDSGKSIFSRWKKRFFILNIDGRLWSLSDENKKQPIKNSPIYIKGMKFWLDSEKKANCIKIERYPKPIYFALEKENVLKRWIEMFKKVGGIECGDLITNEEIKKSGSLKISVSDGNVSGLNKTESTSSPKGLKRKGSAKNLLMGLKRRGMMKMENYPKYMFHPVIGNKDLSNWKNKDFLEWLKCKYIVNSDEDNYGSLKMNNSCSLFTKYYSNFDKDFNGKKIENLKEVDLIKIGITKLGHRKIIIKMINELIFKRVFLYHESCVRNKIEKASYRIGIKLVEFSYLGNENWNFIVKYLSDVDSLKHSYLNPSFRSISKFFPSDFDDSDEEVEGEDDKNKKLIKKDDKTEEKEELEVIEDDELLEEENDMNELRNKSKEEFEIPLKIYIHEKTNVRCYKSNRSLVEPVLSSIPLTSNFFGDLQTSIIIGPFLIEWNQFSLAIPKKLSSSMALVTEGILPLKIIKNTTFDEVCEIIAKVICEWNCKFKYRKMSREMNNGEKLKNCQEFVDEIMKVLGIDLNDEKYFDKEYKQFLNKIRDIGDTKMEFIPSREFKEHYKLDLRIYTFESHSEFDEFVTNLKKIDEQTMKGINNSELNLEDNFKSAYRLFQSFDRIFWLRHFKSPDEDVYKPSECPFKDPRKTDSYMMYS